MFSIGGFLCMGIQYAGIKSPSISDFSAFKEHEHVKCSLSLLFILISPLPKVIVDETQAILLWYQIYFEVIT